MAPISNFTTPFWSLSYVFTHLPSVSAAIVFLPFRRNKQIDLSLTNVEREGGGQKCEKLGNPHFIRICKTDNWNFLCADQNEWASMTVCPTLKRLTTVFSISKGIPTCMVVGSNWGTTAGCCLPLPLHWKPPPSPRQVVIIMDKETDGKRQICLC